VITYVCAFLSLMMAALMQFFITYSLAMMAFWILEITTIVFIVYSFEYFLGGQMFPVDIMPAGIQAVMKWLPFYYELFCPIAIFMERLRELECYKLSRFKQLALDNLVNRALHVETRSGTLSGGRGLGCAEPHNSLSYRVRRLPDEGPLKRLRVTEIRMRNSRNRCCSEEL